MEWFLEFGIFIDVIGAGDGSAGGVFVVLRNNVHQSLLYWIISNVALAWGHPRIVSVTWGGPHQPLTNFTNL